MVRKAGQHFGISQPPPPPNREKAPLRSPHLPLCMKERQQLTSPSWEERSKTAPALWEVKHCGRDKPSTCLHGTASSFCAFVHGMDSNVMPRQLLQFCRLPFFGILAIRPLAQSSGTTFLSQMFPNRSVRTSTEVLRSAFSISA